jgi:putative ABC transport system permease protein
MSFKRKPIRFRLWLWLIRLFGIIVPARLRSEWQLEWEAELQHREALLNDWDRLNWRTRLNLIKRSSSAFWDALWLLPRRLEDEMIQDLRLGLRMLLKNKSFTAVAVLSLALGIGANTAIFQLVEVVQLRMLPVKAPAELVEVQMTSMDRARGGFLRDRPTVTNLIWEQFRDRQQAFSNTFAWGPDRVNLSQGGEVRLGRMLYLSGDAFNTLGLNPQQGRLFNAADDFKGCTGAGMVLSHDFWQREFGGDPNVTSRKVTLGENQFPVIGVTPASFFGMEVGRSFDMALPICAIAQVRGNRRFLDSGVQWWLTITGRLKPGWTIDQAAAHAQQLSPAVFETSLPANYPANSVDDYRNSKLTAIAGGSGISQLRDTYEQSLWLLLGVAGLVLLIACANLTNLLLARASSREREIAVRRALGASRLRLIRQLLVESLLLASIGSVLGLVLAQVLSRFLVTFFNTGTEQVFLDLTPNWKVLGFAAGLAIVTCLLFGLAPAIRSTRLNLNSVLKSGGRGLTAGRERFSLRRALVVTQVALSLVLVAGALLFSRSLAKLMDVDTGFQAEDVLTSTIVFQRLNLPPERIPAFKDQIVERIRVIPGVEAAATGMTPFRDWGGGSVWADGRDASQAMGTNLSRVGPEYFKTLKIPLISGRDFDARDKVGSPDVAIVNEAFAKRFFEGVNPVGKGFWVGASPGSPDTRFEIVGVVGNTKNDDLREAFPPTAYYAAAQDDGAGAGATVLVRSRLSHAQTVAAMNQALSEINPAISVSYQNFKPMIEATILRERLLSTLSGFFGVLALILASIGLYGILSYGVASRINEIGIRMALGAKSRDVFWLILREAVVLVIIGVVLGLPLIVAGARLAATLLFNVGRTDPFSLIVAAVSLLAVAILAGYLPSRRATRVDPLVALRYE